MTVLRFYCQTITEPLTELEGAEAHHLSKVLRLRAGDTVELFDGAGKLAKALIEQISRHKVQLVVEKVKIVPRRLSQIKCRGQRSFCRYI